VHASQSSIWIFFLIMVASTNVMAKKMDLTQHELVGVWDEETTRVDFQAVYDLAFDREGNLYIADYRNNRVGKFGLQGKLVKIFDHVRSPHGIFVDSYNHFYTVNYMGHTVQKYDPKGHKVAEWGKKGRAPGLFWGTVSIVVDRAGAIFVADYHNHRIQKFDPNGQFLQTWGEKGEGPGQFDEPHGIAVDQAGNIYVADRNNGRIQVFTGDGALISILGEEFLEDDRLEPLGVTVDVGGNVYVADMHKHRIVKFSADGKVLSQWGDRGQRPGQFNVPTNIAIRSDGMIFVSEEGNFRIQLFSTDPLRAS